jgi:hypothetical protein
MKIVALGLIGGAAVTALTGLISNTPPQLVGAEHYGYPLPWLFRLILAPEYFPWRVDALGLVVDFAAWTIVIADIVFVWTKIKSRRAQG